ncbi:MAG: DUF2927 domain-containing protein [Pararhodobacter sp.]
MKTPLFALSLLALAGCASTTEVARLEASISPVAPMAIYRPGPVQPFPPARANAEMVQDFLELGFQMESGRPIEAFSRYEGPVKVVTRGTPPLTAIPDLDRLLGRLRAEAGIDITRVPQVAEGDNAIIVEFLPRRQMQAIVPAAACFVVPNVASWEDFLANRRSPVIDWTRIAQRTRAAVFIPDDTTPQEIRDCLHEEIAQALGPLNDLFRLTDSVFNDDNFQTTLTGFDMLILRVWHSPELSPGMSRPQVASRLPVLFNRLNPAGRGQPATLAGETPRVWQLAIEQALSSEGGLSNRREGAARALALALEQGWNDSRLALSLMLMARMAPRDRGETALDALLAAAEIYRRLPGGEIHAAHIDMHLAVQALATGQTQMALDLVNGALPYAQRTENAAFLASLGFIAAEAQALQGNVAEADRLRLDSMAAARYGFGSEAAAQARLDEIARIAGAAQRLAAL